MDRRDAEAPEVTLLPLTEADWPQVQTVHAEGIATGHATFESAPPASWVAFDTARSPGHRTGAHDQHGHLLGWAAVSAVSSRPAYAGVVEHSVYVAAAARGRGVGRLLLLDLLATTEAAGIWTVQASVFPENTASLALHQAAGFRRIGTRRRIARMTHGPMAGQWRDTVLIERRSPAVGT